MTTKDEARECSFCRGSGAESLLSNSGACHICGGSGMQPVEARDAPTEARLILEEVAEHGECWCKQGIHGDDRCYVCKATDFINHAQPAASEPCPLPEPCPLHPRIVSGVEPDGPAVDAIAQAKERCMDCFNDSAAMPGNEAAMSADLDALIAAARTTTGRADLSALTDLAEKWETEARHLKSYSDDISRTARIDREDLSAELRAVIARLKPNTPREAGMIRAGNEWRDAKSEKDRIAATPTETCEFKLKLQHGETGRLLELTPDERGVIDVPRGWDVIGGQIIPDGIGVQGVTTLDEIFGTGTAQTGPKSAAEVNIRSLNEAFINHLDQEGHEVTNDPINDFPRKYATFLAGAEFGYKQQPDTAALLAIAAEIKARAEYYRSSDWSESAEICYQWAECIEGVLNRKTAPDEQGGRG